MRPHSVGLQARDALHWCSHASCVWRVVHLPSMCLTERKHQHCEHAFFFFCSGKYSMDGIDHSGHSPLALRKSRRLMGEAPNEVKVTSQLQHRVHRTQVTCVALINRLKMNWTFCYWPFRVTAEPWIEAVWGSVRHLHCRYKGKGG